MSQPLSVSDPLVSVLIPVFNEERTIGEVIDKVDAVPLRKEIIVVDDGSSDTTADILRSRSTVLKRVHESRVNLGKGLAVRIGLTYVEGDIVIIQDADLELDPAEYRQLLAPIVAGRCNVVYGSRFARPSGTTVPLATRFGNRVLAWLTNLIYGTRLTDMTTAYKVMRAPLVLSLRLESRGFEFEPEITAKLARLGERIVEVPISYQPRTPDEGKKIKWHHGLLYIYTLLRWRFVTAARLRRTSAKGLAVAR